MPQEMLSASDVSRELNVTLMTIHAWRRGSERRPPLPVAIGKQGRARRVRVYRRDLKEWLAQWRPDLLRHLREKGGAHEGARHLSA